MSYGQQCLMDRNVYAHNQVVPLVLCAKLTALRLLEGIAKGECHVNFAAAVGSKLKNSVLFGCCLLFAHIIVHLFRAVAIFDVTS